LNNSSSLTAPAQAPVLLASADTLSKWGACPTGAACFAAAIWAISGGDDRIISQLVAIARLTKETKALEPYVCPTYPEIQRESRRREKSFLLAGIYVKISGTNPFLRTDEINQ
jgi:hypothetical protein